MAQGLAPSRTRAQALILAGVVVEAASGRRLDKPGATVGRDVSLRLKGQPQPFASRGGLKLDAVLDPFGVTVDGCVCLDVGASTGGFTDCLLQRGAARVHALDVGYGQLAWHLRSDPRVVNHERCNVRTAPDDLLGERVSRVVIDVSFISLTKVVPAVLRFMAPEAQLVALVKPQFEVGPAKVGKGGIVRDSALRQEALATVVAAADAAGLRMSGCLPSPILGQKGNHEFLVHARLPA